jgi:hypothetical protein
VPKGVVDRLEVVQVNEEDGGRARLDLRRERMFEPVHEERPVGQSGQRVMEGPSAQLVLELAALGHVEGGPQQTGHGIVSE